MALLRASGQEQQEDIRTGAADPGLASLCMALVSLQREWWPSIPWGSQEPGSVA